MIKQKSIQHVIFLEGRHQGSDRAALCKVASIQLVSMAEVLQLDLPYAWIPDWVPALSTLLDTTVRGVGCCSLLTPPVVTSLSSILQPLADMGCPHVQHHHVRGFPFVRSMVVWQRPHKNHPAPPLQQKQQSAMRQPDAAQAAAAVAPQLQAHPEPKAAAQGSNMHNHVQQQQDSSMVGSFHGSRQASGVQQLATSSLPTAATSTGKQGTCATALMKQEVGTTMVTPQPVILQYWLIADQPWNSSEVQQLPAK